MKVVYLHGWLSSPLSYKVQVLRENGFQVLAPELPAEDWGQSVINARKAIKEFAPDVVVGSSRGGQNHRMQDDEAIGAILEALNEYR